MEKSAKSATTWPTSTRGVSQHFISRLQMVDQDLCKAVVGLMMFIRLDTAYQLRSMCGSAIVTKRSHSSCLSSFSVMSRQTL